MTDKEMFDICRDAIAEAFDRYGFEFVNQYGFGQLVRRAWRDTILYKEECVQDYFHAVFGGDEYAEAYKQLPVSNRPGYEG